MILTVTANPAIDKAYFVDRFEMGQVHRPLRIAASAGGKGLNVSRVATILGQTVTAMGFLGGSADLVLPAHQSNIYIPKFDSFQRA